MSSQELIEHTIRQWHSQMRNLDEQHRSEFLDISEEAEEELVEIGKEIADYPTVIITPSPTYEIHYKIEGALHVVPVIPRNRNTMGLDRFKNLCKCEGHWDYMVLLYLYKFKEVQEMSKYNYYGITYALPKGAEYVLPEEAQRPPAMTL